MRLLEYWSNAAEQSADNVRSRRKHYSAEQVFHRYVPRVYSLARRLMGHEADAEDVTQDVLVQVVRKLQTFRGEADLATWLHRVTVNAALAQRRKQARRRERQVEAPLASLQEHSVMGETLLDFDGPEQDLLDRESQEMVEQAIASLPDVYRDVYVLADVERLSNDEVRRLLGLSLAAVKSRLHRARLMMREALTSYF